MRSPNIARPCDSGEPVSQAAARCPWRTLHVFPFRTVLRRRDFRYTAARNANRVVGVGVTGSVLNTAP